MKQKAARRLVARRRFRDLSMLSKRQRREAVAPIDVSMTTSRRIVDDPILFPGLAAVLRQRNEIMAAEALAGSFYAPDAVRLFNGTTAAVPAPQETLTIEALQRTIAALLLGAEYRAIHSRTEAQLYQQLFGRGPMMGMLAAGGATLGPPVNLLQIYRAIGDGLVTLPRYPRIETETAARAQQRARGLLKSLLTPGQWAEFERTGAVTEQIDGCEFILRPGGMIEARKPRMIRADVGEFWCIAPADEEWLPPEDKLIGQLLHLRAGPDKLREAANIFPAW